MALAWSDQRMLALRRLFSEGRSDKEIGAALGVSTRAVIGKRYRLELLRNGRKGGDPYALAIRRAERDKADSLS